MPLILAAPKVDRAVVEPVAQTMQAAADAHVPAMVRYIAASVRNAVAAIDDTMLLRGIEAQDMTQVIDAIPVLAPSWHPHVALQKADTSGSTLADRLAAQYRDGMRLAVQLAPRFDLVDQHAVDWARERAGKLLSDLDGQALVNARNAIAYGIERGRTVDETARYLRSTLYLPPRGEQAVQRYFDALIERVEKGDSLAEAARAAGASRALAPRQFLDAKNIDTLTDRYAERWVKYNAESVARTMTIEASNAGLRGGWDEAAAEGMFDPVTASIVWYATQDDLVCPECLALDGTPVAFIKGGFETSAGFVAYPPAHPSCRCTLVLVTQSFNPNAARAVAPRVPASDLVRAEAPPGTLASITDAAEARGVKLDVVDHGTHISVDRIVVPAADRSEGIGSDIMRQIVQVSNERGIPITLSPSTDFGGTKSGLDRFYRERFDFVRNTRGRFPESTDALVRMPDAVVDRSVGAEVPVGEHVQFVEALRAKYALDDIRIIDAQDHLVVEHIGAKKGSRDALNVIKDVISEGDRRGLPVTITPSDLTSPSRTILRQMGFKSSRGQFGETLMREPMRGVVLPPPPIPRVPVPEPRPIPEPPTLPPPAPEPPPVVPPWEDPHQIFQMELRTKYGLDDIRIGDHGTHVSIDHIGATKGDGKARKVIEDVLKEADRRGVSVTITPSDATSPSPTVLRQLGFKSSKGQYNEALVREPGGVGAPRIPRPTEAPKPTVPPRLADTNVHMASNDISWSSRQVQRTYGQVFDDLDKIHSFAPDAPDWNKFGYMRGDNRARTDVRSQLEIFARAQTASEKAKGTGGWYMSGQGRIKTMANIPVEQNKFTLIHEFGHAMDNAWAGSKANVFGSEGYGISSVTGAIERGAQSPEVQKAWAAWHDATYGSAKLQNAAAEFRPQFLSYFRSEREVWARSYSQYMANRLGGEPLDGLRWWQRMTRTQWTDQDFANHRIGEAVEGVLRAMGLMR